MELQRSMPCPPGLALNECAGSNPHRPLTCGAGQGRVLGAPEHPAAVLISRVLRAGALPGGVHHRHTDHVLQALRAGQKRGHTWEVWSLGLCRLHAVGPIRCAASSDTAGNTLRVRLCTHGCRGAGPSAPDVLDLLKGCIDSGFEPDHPACSLALRFKVARQRLAQGQARDTYRW